METPAAGMGRGKDPVRRDLRRAVRHLMTGTASRTKLLTVPQVVFELLERLLNLDQLQVECP